MGAVRYKQGKKVMFLQFKKLVTGGVILLLLLLLGACSSGESDSSNQSTGNGSSQNQGSTLSATATVTPQVIAPKSSGGSSGHGPLTISSPTPVPGGRVGSQQIVLGDRTLIINSVIKQKGVSPNTSLITLDVAVRDTSAKAIMNLPAFYRLIGPEGDTFSYQYNSSDDFYGTIAVHATRSGIIVFQVPAASTSSLRLLYRPEIATETAIILLKISQ
jgi:hypothetical protein